MHRLHIGIVAWILWGTWMLSSHGQALPEWLTASDVPKPPDFGVRDEAGFFKRESATMKRISDQLQSLEERHGYRIYLIVKPVLVAASAPEMAARLQQAWLPDGDGLVVVFESDSRQLGFGRDVGGNPTPEDHPSRVPTHETATMLMRATAITESDLAPDAYLEALIGALVNEFNEYFEARKEPPPVGRSLRFALLTIGGLTLLALGAILVGTMSRLPSTAGSPCFHFPMIDRSERLGAPFGGGNVSTWRFSAKTRTHLEDETNSGEPQHKA